MSAPKRKETAVTPTRAKALRPQDAPPPAVGELATLLVAVLAAVAKPAVAAPDPEARARALERAKRSALNKSKFWFEASRNLPDGTKRQRSALNKAKFWGERAKEIDAKIATEKAGK